MKAEPVMKVEEKGQVKESLEEARTEEPKELNKKTALAGRTKLLPTVAYCCIINNCCNTCLSKNLQARYPGKSPAKGKFLLPLLPFRNMTNDSNIGIFYKKLFRTI